MKAHYTKARVIYSGLVPKSVEEGPQGAIVQTSNIHSVGHALQVELNQFKVIGVLAEPDNWRQPPHVALANWRFDSVERACAFTRQYGALHIQESVVRIDWLRKWQETLRKHWHGEDAALWTAFQPRIENGEVVIEIGDLWPYISFLAQTDRYERKLAVCPNIDNTCPAPYFLKERSDQRFCSAECRNFLNVQRWRSNPKNATREKRKRKKRERHIHRI
jgi:hypothetical protein